MKNNEAQPFAHYIGESLMWGLVWFVLVGFFLATISIKLDNVPVTPYNEGPFTTFDTTTNQESP